MTVSVDQVSSNAMADTLNTEIGANHELRLYSAADAELATMTFSGSAVVSTVGSAEVLTYSEASYTDEASANAGTVSYATIRRTAATAREVIRFSDPTNELSLSSTTITAGQAVNVTADVVITLPNST